MAITLGGIALPDGSGTTDGQGVMIWDGEHKPAPAALDSVITAGGRYHYSAQPYIGGA